MTVMQRASWLAAYGGVLGEDLLAQLAVTEHLQIWRRRLAGNQSPAAAAGDRSSHGQIVSSVTRRPGRMPAMKMREIELPTTTE